MPPIKRKTANIGTLDAAPIAAVVIALKTTPIAITRRGVSGGRNTLVSNAPTR